MTKNEEVAREMIKAINETCSDIHNGLRLEECKACGPKLKRVLPILTRAYGQSEPPDAEQIRVHAALAFDTVYSDNFCLRCSHDPSNCECAEPVYMPTGWKLIPELEKLKAAYGQGEQGWQPIESAPKMRKIVVSYVNSHGKRRTVLACYYTDKALEMDDDYADVGEQGEDGQSFAPAGWYEEHDSDSPLMPLQEKPTHWRPLPEPPSSAKGENSNE